MRHKVYLDAKKSIDTNRDPVVQKPMESVALSSWMERIDDLILFLNMPRNYRWQIRNFIKFCAENNLRPDALAFKKAADRLYISVQENRVSASTYNLYLSANRQLVMRLLQLREATAIELFAAAQIMKSRAVKIDPCKDPSTVLTSQEIDILAKYSTPRGKLIIELLKITALRISEALKLPREMNVAGDHLETTIVGKGGKTRQVFIPKNLHNAIVEKFQGKYFLLETKRSRMLDRKGVLKMLKVAASKAVENGKACPSLLNKAKLHNFRHAWAHAALNKNLDLHSVSRYLGHTSTEITSKHYIRRKPNAEQILGIYDSIYA